MKSAVRGTDQKNRLDGHEMQIYDARPAQHKLTIDQHGFFVARLKNTALPETIEVLLEEGEHAIRSIYWPEVCDLVQRTLLTGDGRRPKYVFALGTQKFTEDKSRGLLGSYSRSAHADFSDVVFDGAYKMLTKRGVPEQEALSMDLMLVNAWRPFGQVIHDNALTVLDWTSVDPSRDAHGQPRGAPITKGNILAAMVTYNPQHRWVYLPQMTPEEVWVFKQADSRDLAGVAKHAFHTSFKDIGQDGTDESRTRRSIAIRLMCAFEKEPRAAAL